METNLSTQERALIMIAVGVAVVFGGLFAIITNKSSDQSLGIADRNSINYKMARPEVEFAGYDLNGREIDHQFEGSAQRQPMDSKAAGIQSKSAQAKSNIKGVNNKKDQAKKSTTAAAKPAARPAAQPQTQIGTRVQSKGYHMENGSAEAANFSTATNNGRSVNLETENPAVDQQNAETKKAKKSFSEWRAEIFASADRKAITSFLESYKKGDVSNQEVQAMAQDLLDQNNENLKGLGFYILRSTPSLASLSQLAHIQAQVPTGLKSYYDQSLLAYLQGSQVAYLNQALATKDTVLIKVTLNLLGVNLQKISSGQISDIVDPRYKRDGDLSSLFSMANYKTLLPALQALGSSSDQEISGMAQQVTGLIQSYNTVASF